MTKMQYSERARKNADRAPTSHYASRLQGERKADFDAYLKIVQYEGGIRGPEDAKSMEWAPRFDLLDPGCRQLYVRALLMYDGCSFSQILRKERELNQAAQPHTIQRRLDSLIAQGLAYRVPPEGGRGIRGQYFFRGPHEVRDIDSGIPLPLLIQSMRRYVEEPIDKSARIERLADLLEMLVLQFGAGMTQMLRRLLTGKNAMTERKIFRFINNESYQLDLNVDFVAMRLLVKEYPDLARSALDILAARLRKERAVKENPSVAFIVKEIQQHQNRKQ